MEADFSTLLPLWFVYVPRSSVRQHLWTFVFFKTLFGTPNSINMLYAHTRFYLIILWNNRSQSYIILVLSDSCSSEKWSLTGREIISSTEVHRITFHSLFCIYTGVLISFNKLKRQNYLTECRIRFFGWIICWLKM